jgi:hypothetical protein
VTKSVSPIRGRARDRAVHLRTLRGLRPASPRRAYTCDSSRCRAWLKDGSRFWNVVRASSKSAKARSSRNGRRDDPASRVGLEARTKGHSSSATWETCRLGSPWATSGHGGRYGAAQDWRPHADPADRFSPGSSAVSCHGRRKAHVGGSKHRPDRIQPRFSAARARNIDGVRMDAERRARHADRGASTRDGSGSCGDTATANCRP